MVNPYTYKNFEVTEEPAEDPDPSAADSIAGFELQNPFGQYTTLLSIDECEEWISIDDRSHK
jgi:hypothetical protein